MNNITCCQLIHRDDSGQTVAMVAPSWGANVIALSFQAPEWAWPLPILEPVDIASLSLQPSSYGIPILAPTPGRVGRNQDGRITYRGIDYRITPSRHGFLRYLPWTVTDQTKNSITCAVDVDPKGMRFQTGSFPFEFHGEYRVELVPGGVYCRARFINTGKIHQPMNIGWHPYLFRSGPCRVCIPASSRWALYQDKEPTPTGRLLAVSGSDDFRKGRVLDCHEHWDDVFTDLAGEQGRTCAWVEEDASSLTKKGDRLHYTVRRLVEVQHVTGSNGSMRIPNIQLYTPPGRQAISIEPLSAPPNALNLLARGHERADVCELAPGEQTMAELHIAIKINQTS